MNLSWQSKNSLTHDRHSDANDFFAVPFAVASRTSSHQPDPGDRGGEKVLARPLLASDTRQGLGIPEISKVYVPATSANPVTIDGYFI